MNERLKELRKILGLSGDKFGEPLGVTRTAISLLESGKNNLTGQMLKLICLTYNVNEAWLRTGEGEMFNRAPDGFFAELQQRHGLTDFQLGLVKSYLNLTDSERSAIDKLIAAANENPDDHEI